MNSRADFLNHGMLPFVGREAEMQRIVEFWRGVFHARGLRTMVLYGEAGVGKSRLLEHSVQAIVECGGCVPHVKLYPDAAHQLVPLLAQALWRPDVGRSILASEPSSRFDAVCDALQRLARLRPTMIVLEDIHLLGGESLPALDRLLGMLADETISVLCLARNVEVEARGVLEPFLVQETQLHGLTADHCARIFEQVTGTVAGADAIAVLHETTAGNPLALRSALRGALTFPTAVEGDFGSTLQTAEGARLLAGSMRRSVALLATAMTSHLSPEERRDAARLACLGEVFSREAAAVMVENIGPILDVLIFKGIIATAVAPPIGLPGAASAQAPLGFTHSLLHRQLYENASSCEERLVRVVAGEPLYSTLPFQLLGSGRWNAEELDMATIARAFDRTMQVQIGLGRSSLWRSADLTWRTAVLLVGCRLGRWRSEDWDRMIVRLLNHRLNQIRLEPESVRLRWLKYLAAITEPASSDELAAGRFHVLYHRDLLSSEGNPAVTRASWKEAEALVAERPSLRHTFAYTDYIIAACAGANDNDDREMMRNISVRVDELLASDELPARVRREFELRVRPPLLTLYDSDEELQARMEQVREYDRMVVKSDLSVWTFCVDFLAESAFVDMLVNVCDIVIPLMRRQGLPAPMADAVARLQCVLAGSADSLVDASLAVEHAIAEIPSWRRPIIQSTIALHLVDAALLRGEVSEALRLIGQYGVADGQLKPVRRALLALDADGASDSVTAGRSFCDIDDVIALIASLGNIAGDADLDAVIQTLSAPVLRLSDVLRAKAILSVIRRAADHMGLDNLADVMLSEARSLLVRSLEWLTAPERCLVSYADSLLERSGTLLTQRQRSAWEKRLAELRGKRGTGNGVTPDERLRLSLLGSVVVRMPDGQQQRFQGARARMLLAMMAINQMLSEPLSPNEFCRITAGGDVVDIENARDVVKATVHRVRDIVGRDVILMESGIPRLNLERISVDVLDVHALLRRAREALRRASPMQAASALHAALDLIRGEVPFPSLYDEFIEGAREDFENDLRTTAVDAANALAREGGGEDAIVVLRGACDAFPGDEELIERLRDELLKAGSHAEAERVRRRLGE